MYISSVAKIIYTVTQTNNNTLANKIAKTQYDCKLQTNKYALLKASEQSKFYFVKLLFFLKEGCWDILRFVEATTTKFDLLLSLICKVK